MTTYAGTREFAEKVLGEGYRLSCLAWTFWSDGWTCNGGCCNDEGLTVEEVLEALENLCGSNYEKVRVEMKP